MYPAKWCLPGTCNLWQWRSTKKKSSSGHQHCKSKEKEKTNLAASVEGQLVSGSWRGWTQVMVVDTLGGVRSGPSEGRGQRQPNNQHRSDCDNARRGPPKLWWVQWTVLLQRGCLVGCRREWMGTSGLQKCLNAMEGMVEDSSRA